MNSILKKDTVDYIEHLKRSVKCKPCFCPGEKQDICSYLDDVKKYIEEHD